MYKRQAKRNLERLRSDYELAEGKSDAYLISGDNPGSVAAVAATLGIDQPHAQVLPCLLYTSRR